MDQATPTPRTFPANELDIRTEVFFNLLGWTNISQYVGDNVPIQISRGHPDESTTTAPSQATATLFNADGRFTSLNPMGPWFGLFGRNTQMRVSVPEGITYLRSEYDSTSYAWCPNTAALQFTGNLDFQIDAALNSWHSVALAGQWNDISGPSTWMLFVNAAGYPTFVWSSGVEFQSTAPLPEIPTPQRRCLRVTYNSTTGAVTFYTSPPGLGSPVWTQLGAASAFGSGFPLVSSTQELEIGYVPNANLALAYSEGYAQDYNTAFPFVNGFSGKIYAAKLIANGTVVADPDWTAQTAGTTSFTDSAGNTFGLNGSATIDDRKYRFHGEVAAWPKKWSPVGNDAYTMITAGGLLRRTSRVQSSTNSAMYRALTRLTGASAPVAYWSCEDGQHATQMGSALSGGTAMRISSGTPKMASDSNYACSAALPVLNGSTWVAEVPPYTTSGASSFAFLFDPQNGEATQDDAYNIATVYMNKNSAYASFVVGYSTPGLTGIVDSIQIAAFTPAGGSPAWTFAVQIPGVAGTATLAGHPSLVVCQIGATSATLYVWTESFGWLTTTQTFASTTVGTISRIVVNDGRGGLFITGGETATTPFLLNSAVGHLAVFDGILNAQDLTGPVNAWLGEFAGMRFQRLCIEEGIPFIGRGNLTDTVKMGPQTIETISALLQECVDSDQALWTEPRSCAGFGFRTRVNIGNQAPAVIFDYNQDHLSPPLEPTEDDQTTINDVTVTQPDGTSARAVKNTGPLSVNAPPNGVGRYDTSLSVNLEFNSDLANIANWSLWKSTTPVSRFPGVSCDLANTALTDAMYYAIQDMDLGDRFQIANTPPWEPPGVIDQIVQQCNETLFIKTFLEKWVGIPATPWNVAYLDDLNYGRLDTSGSETQTAISGALNTNPYFAAPANPLSGPTPGSVGSLNGWAGFLGSLSLDNGTLYPGGPFAWSCVFTGTPGGSILGNGFSVVASSAGNFTCGWVYSPTAGNVEIGLNWNHGNTFLSQSLTSVAVAANTWTPISSAALTAPPTADTAFPIINSVGSVLVAQGVTSWNGGPLNVTTPNGPFWTTNVSDFPFAITVSPVPELPGEQMMVTGIAAPSGRNQVFSVVRGLNGVAVAQAAGNDVRLSPAPVISI